jgi:hypothetical protein
MALHLTNLDLKTRSLMVNEIERDIAAGRLYLSSRLNSTGNARYPQLLKEAARARDAAWLAQQILDMKLLRVFDAPGNAAGTVPVPGIPVAAPVTLAEYEFNRFYCRGVCARAIEEGKLYVRAYRAKENVIPDRDIQKWVGAMINAEQLLVGLRINYGIESDERIPEGLNSGLSVQLP